MDFDFEIFRVDFRFKNDITKISDIFLHLHL